MFLFASPHFLWLLLALPALAWLVRRRAARRESALRYSDVRLAGAVPRTWALRARRVLPALRGGALVLLVLALARPQFGTVERDVVQEGVDLFYCLDISGSMRAEDFRPNRLEKAKELIDESLQRRPNDRQGLVVFAGGAFVLCPLTFDESAVREFLSDVTFDDIGAQGTAIGLGLARALKKLKDSQAKSRVVVLLTDGVDQGDWAVSPREAAAAAKELGVRVYAIGVGSDGPVYLSLPTPLGMRRQLLRDSLDEETLRAVAETTGGIYRRAETAEELDAILREIDRLEKTEIEMREFRQYDERMAVFAWPAALLLLLELALANTRFLRVP